MIVTLGITIIVEGAVALGYSLWRKKPVWTILFTSIIANLVTQSLLWIVLHLLFRQYLIVLIVAEILIWFVEGLLFYLVPTNQLDFQEAVFLSLNVNLTSFALGWFCQYDFLAS